MGNAGWPVVRHVSPGDPIRDVQYLAFGVGSIRGLAFIDALDELRRHRDLSQVRGLVGSSAGAMCALAFCLGLSRDEMLRFFLVTSWFTQTPWRLRRNCSRWSLIDLAPLRNALRLQLATRGIDPDVDFEHFGQAVARLRRPSHALDLRVLTYNISTRQPQVFSRERTPRASVVEATLASCAMPGVLPPVTIGEHCFVDGVLTDELPMDEFPPDKTLGFYLFDAFRSPSRARARFARLKPEHHVVTIPVSKLGVLEFNPGPELRAWILQQGRQAVRAYFEQKKATS